MVKSTGRVVLMAPQKRTVVNDVNWWSPETDANPDVVFYTTFHSRVQFQPAARGPTCLAEGCGGGPLISPSAANAGNECDCPAHIRFQLRRERRRARLVAALAAK